MKLVIEHLSKSYGEKEVLKDISFEFQQGKIYGLLGRNGAGKTTLFSCLDELIQYQQGKVYIEDDFGHQELLDQHNLGLVLTTPMLPEFLTGYEFIRTYMQIVGVEDEESMQYYFDLISLSKEDQNRLIKDYSMGMKNKVQLIMFLISKPKVLLLDEPLTSFDVIVASEIKEALKQLKNDHIIIFSTHVLELATNLCDEIVVMNHGQLSLVDNEMIHSQDFEAKIVEILKDEKEPA